MKDESRNPTGSVKARGLAVAVSMARSLGATDVCIASAGSAAGTLAAYAARGGLGAHVFMPKDADSSFARQAQAFGASVSVVDGSVADAAATARLCASDNGWYDCTALREPFRLEGSKTVGYEIAEQFGFRLPEAVIQPTGGGSGLISLWKAFDELEEMGFIGPARPRMYAVQAAGCAPLVRAFEKGLDFAPPWTDTTETLASGLRVTETGGDFLVLRALHKSRGSAVAVTDDEILHGLGSMARAEGLLMSIEGGAGVAALRKLKATGHITPGDVAVLLNPGAGSECASILPASPPPLH